MITIQQNSRSHEKQVSMYPNPCGALLSQEEEEEGNGGEGRGLEFRVVVVLVK
jgi:hypothetical protein